MRAAGALLALLLLVAAPTAQSGFGAVERVADGVLLYRLDDPTLLDPAGPIAVQALRVDPVRNRIDVALAQDTSPARETVPALAARLNAVAAINGGFFGLANGAPSGILKSGGRLIGGTKRARGAVGFLQRGRSTRLIFDRVIVDKSAPAKLTTRLGSRPQDWRAAPGIVSGAGLLMLNGREMDDWADEQIATGFDTTRHPRTMIGVDRENHVWLVTVDGRQPALSLGMSFSELKRLARRLGLESALNLDGGGSTTMVIKDGVIVNHPSDPTGPRPVSDAIVVRPARRPSN